jgi:hypothetical protein
VHKVIQSLHQVNTLLRQEDFTEASLLELEVQIKLLQECMVDTFGLYSSSGLATPKMHCLVHFPRFIRLYGAPRNWDTGTYELFHKLAAKLPWLRTNRHSDTDAAMLRVVEGRNLVAQLVQQDKDAAEHQVIAVAKHYYFICRIYVCHIFDDLYLVD